MGRQYTPFEIVVQHTKEKTSKEIQSIIDDFYIEQVKIRLQQNPVSHEEKSRMLDLLIRSQQAAALDSTDSNN